MELRELIERPHKLLEELKEMFSDTATLPMITDVIKAYSNSGIPISAYERKPKIKDKQSLEQFIQDKGSGHTEYSHLYDKVKKDKTLILGIPNPSKTPPSPDKEKAAKKRMALATKYDWSFYTCQSLHNRSQPEKKKHDGIINWVRITLPEKDARIPFHPHENDIKTPLGDVRAKDHLVFSNEGLRHYVFNKHYPNGINKPGVQPKLPDFERVDLVTPARYDGFRFAPLAIYIGYQKKDSTTPLFYAMTGGNALGESKVLYVSTEIDKEVLMECGYKPTPFSDPRNYYQFKVTFDKMNPVHVSIKVFTKCELENKKPYHFNINLILEEIALDVKNKTKKEDRIAKAAKVASVENFIPPIHQLFSAISRIKQLKEPMIPNTKVPPYAMEIARLKRKRTEVASKHPERKNKIDALNKKIKKLEKKREH